MFQGQSEASAPSAEEIHPSDNTPNLDSPEGAWQPVYTEDGRGDGYHKAKISGEGNYATSSPVTCRNRHRRQPKNKTPVTAQEAIKHVHCLRRKYVDMQRRPQKWNVEHLIEETNHARLHGDLAQALAELIERISDVNPSDVREAALHMRKLSKKGYGSLRAREASLPAPVPDHVNEWNGEYLIQSKKHHRAMSGICRKFGKLIEALTK